MWPELCTLPGGTVIHTYGLASALALGVLVFGAARMAPTFGVERESVYDIGLLSTFGGIAGSRLEHVRTNWHLYSENLGGIFAREGGHVFYGGLIANLVLVVAYFAWKRRSPGPMLGLLAPFIALGLGIGRLGCLAAGCCYGAPTDVPWGIVFPEGDIAPHGIPLHPTQLTASAYAFGLAAWLFHRQSRARFPSEPFLLFAMTYPLLRSANELLRGDAERGWALEGWLTNAQAISLGLGLAAALLWWWLPRRHEPGNVR